MYDKYLATWKGPSRRSLPVSVQDAINAYFCIIDQSETAPIDDIPDQSITIYCYSPKNTPKPWQYHRQESKLPTILLSVRNPAHVAPAEKISSCILNQISPFHALAALTHQLRTTPTLQQQYSDDLYRPHATQDHHEFILNTLSYIEMHLTENLREEAIAERYHYSTAYFSRYFHQCIGISLRSYLCHKRLALAKRLLIEESHTKIAAIAYQCGYHDLSYFNRIFKKKNGISPGRYRQKLLGALQ